ncbi:MAG: DUF2079 domain-containing protein [Myxococcaceae bacterium]|nr:DUF2079 domain-containing protein [Myxococcaceae bacterium]
MARVVRFREHASTAALGLSLAVAFIWFFTALSGTTSSWAIGPIRGSFGHATLLRFATWALLAGVWLSPARESLVAALGHRLRGALGASLAGAFTLFLAVFKATQHLSFRTAGYDLSLYHWAVHRVFAAPFFSAWGLERNYLSEHASPILFAFVPAEVLFGALGLVVLEAIVVGLGLVALFHAARTFDLPPLACGGLALSALTLQPTWQALDFDFHPEAMTLTFAAGLVWAFRRARVLWTVAFAVALLSLKEDSSLVLVCLATLLGLVERARWRWALALVVVGVGWGALAVGLVIPAALPEGHTAWRMVADRYGQWGETSGEVVLALASRPVDVASVLTGPSVRAALGKFAWLPALDPLALLASAPLVAVHVLSRYGDQAGLWGYYALPAVAVWFMGAARGLARLRRVSDAVVVSLAVLPLAMGPVVFAASWPSEEDAAARAVLAAWPSDRTVAAQNALVPHLPVSDRVVRLERWAEAEAVVLRPFANAWPLGDDAVADLVEQLLDTEGFGVASASPALVVLQRGASRDRADEVRGWFRRPR